MKLNSSKINANFFTYMEEKKKDYKVRFLMLLCIVLGFLLTYNCNGRRKAESALNSAVQNVSALSDTLHIERAKNGEIIAQKKALYCDLEEYEKLTSKQKNEIKRLQKELNAKIDYISSVNLEVGRTDTLIIEDIVKVGDTINFAYCDTFRTLEGYIYDYDSPVVAITKDLTEIGLKVGMTESGGIFATSTNPNVRFNSIDGALLSEEIQRLKSDNKKRWSVGLSVVGGFGISSGIGGTSAGVSVTIGIGLHRRLFSF